MRCFPIPAADSQGVLDWVTANAASLTAESPRVAEWLAANAGKTAQDAMAALLLGRCVAALTPAIRTWSLFTFPFPASPRLNINATFVIGAILMLIIFAIQHRGIASTAGAQKWLAIIVLVPLLLIGLLPIFTGKIDMINVTGLVPPTAAYSGVDGAWNNGGWTLFLGGLFIAAWSTYAFETAVCYTRELRNPKTDTFKAIFYSGLLCISSSSSSPSPSRACSAMRACWRPASSTAPASAKRLPAWSAAARSSRRSS